MRVPPWVVCVFFPGVFLSSRVTGACPVTTDLIMRVNVRTTTSTTSFTRQVDTYYQVRSFRLCSKAFLCVMYVLYMSSRGCYVLLLYNTNMFFLYYRLVHCACCTCHFLRSPYKRLPTSQYTCVRTALRIIYRSEYHTQLAKMSFDEIFDLTAGVYFHFL